MREMTHEQGGFYSSLDADSEGEEGRFYIWALEEIREALKADSDFFEAAYGITTKGNSKERRFSNALWMMHSSPHVSNLIWKLFQSNWQNLIPGFYRSAPREFAPAQMTRFSQHGMDLC